MIGEANSLNHCLDSLRALTSDELVQVIKSITHERSFVKECLIRQWHASPTMQTSPSLPSSASSSLSLERLKEGTPRALLRGNMLGGFQQDKPAARFLECWSVILLVLFNVLMLTTVAVSYDLSIGTKTVSWNEFYISSAIDTGLAHRIGGYGLSIGFVAFLLVMFTRYVAVKAQLVALSAARAQRITWFSKFALVLEIFAFLGGLGVANFNQSYNYGVHMTFAFATFFCAVASLFVQSIVDELICRTKREGVPSMSRKWRVFRWILAMLAVSGLCGMFGYGGNGQIAKSSFCELVMATTLFSYYLTWLGSSGTGYVVGFHVFAFDRPECASSTHLQSF
jgi:hypothetical protein